MQEEGPVDIFASLKVASTEKDAPGDLLQISLTSRGFICQEYHGEQQPLVCVMLNHARIFWS